LVLLQKAEGLKAIAETLKKDENCDKIMTLFKLSLLGINDLEIPDGIKNISLKLFKSRLQTILGEIKETLDEVKPVPLHGYLTDFGSESRASQSPALSERSSSLLSLATTNKSKYLQNYINKVKTGSDRSSERCHSRDGMNSEEDIKIRVKELAQNDKV